MRKPFILLAALALAVLTVLAALAVEETSLPPEIRFAVDVPKDIMSLACSPDGKLIATGGGDKVFLWDAATGNRVDVLSAEGLLGHVDAIEFSPDGKYLSMGGTNGKATAVIWDIAENRVSRIFNIYRTVEHRDDGQPVYTTEELIRGYAVKYSPDGKLLAVGGGWGSTVALLDISTGEEILKYSYTNSDDPEIMRCYRVSSFAFNSKCTKLAVGLNRSVDIWNLLTGEFERTLSCDGLGHNHYSTITTVLFSPDGDRVFAYGFDHTTTMWNIITGEIVWKVVNSNTATKIIGYEDVTFCSPCHIGHGCRDCEPVGPYFAYSRGTSAALSPDGKVFVSGCKDKAIAVRDAETGRRIRTDNVLPYVNGPIYALSISDNGDYIAFLQAADKEGEKMKMVVYDFDYDPSPESKLNDAIMNLVDERDTIINLAYSNERIEEAEITRYRLMKTYDEYCEKIVADFNNSQNEAAASPSGQEQPAGE